MQNVTLIQHSRSGFDLKIVYTLIIIGVMLPNTKYIINIIIFFNRHTIIKEM